MSLNRNKNKWEMFANKNAEMYIDLSLSEVPEKKRKEKFFKNGQYLTDMTFDKVERLLPDKDRALEIGAGVGRLSLPHARIFKEVFAVDIAPTMLKKLNKNAKKENLKNIQTFLSEQSWDEASVSYAYSYFVFQHIPDFDIISSYMQRIADCLRHKGIAQLHFDTREKTFLYNMRNLMPDFLLPQTQRKNIRRIRRSIEQLRELFKKCDLEVMETYKHNTANTFFVLRKK